MSIIVIDLEFNQSYDFEDDNPTILNPNCRFEIIQIGAVKLNDTLDIIDTANFLIKPTIYTRIHPYVEKITGINMEMLENQKTFPEAYKDFVEFSNSSKDKILGVWGSSDIKALFRNITHYKIIEKPFIIKYIDIQNITASYLKYNKGVKIGLKNAVEMLNIPINNKFHDAYYDAIYTSEVFKIIADENIKVKIFNSSHIY